MRFIGKIWGILVLVSIAGAANPVYSDPQFATEGDSITIYFDATAGDQGLMGYTIDDVYAHIGVITNLSTSSTNWRYVPGDWNESVAKTKLELIGTNLWKLVIGYPHEYFGCPSGEQIYQIAFVFKNSNQSRTGRMADGSDIYLDLYEPSLTAVFQTPQVDVSYGDPLRTPHFMELGDTLDVIAAAAVFDAPLDSITLFLDGVVIATGTTDTLAYQFIAGNHGAGPAWFKVEAIDSLGAVDSDSIVVMVNPAVQTAAAPAGAIPGINYNSVTSATLALFAPYKDFVYVIGDFNDWQVDTTYYMQRHSDQADSTLWWVTIEGLSPGSEYAFQYLVDGELRIADPYTAKVLDPWNDPYISDAIYPGLKDYPSGKTDQITAVLQTAQTPFSWRNNDYSPPIREELIIYEMHIRDFVADHLFSTLTDTLDYLENLGINAIELMPVNEFEGNSSWGYNPSFYFAVDKYYGRAAWLKEFIDECHGRGIAVIMDVVLNHSYGQSPLARLYWDGSNSRPAADNPWYNQTSNFKNPDAQWGCDFNHESPHTEYFVDRVLAYWLTEFKFDGFRLDFTKGFSNTSWPATGDIWGSGYDAARISNLKRIADQMWNVNPDAYMIMEHLSDNPEEKELANYGMLLWGNSNWNYGQSAMGYSSESDFSWGYYTDRGWSVPHLITYMESHDEERLMYKNLSWGNSSGNYNISDLTTALNRMQLVNGFFLTLPGPKMIWQFGELGYDYSIDYNGRLGAKPVRWDYFQNTDRRRLYNLIKTLLQLRDDQEVFRSAETVADVSYVSGNVKRLRLSHSSMKVVILGNFGVVPLNINPNFYSNGDWYEFFTGDTLTVASPTDNILLGPGELRLYTSSYIEPAEEGLLEINPDDVIVPTELSLSQNYPNPFNPTTTIEFSLPTAGDITLTVYDLLGREVTQLVNGFAAAGWHEATWKGCNMNGKQAAAGVYLYTLDIGGNRITKKLVLLK